MENVDVGVLPPARSSPWAVAAVGLERAALHIDLRDDAKAVALNVPAQLRVRGIDNRQVGLQSAFLAQREPVVADGKRRSVDNLHDSPVQNFLRMPITKPVWSSFAATVP
ncbi:hypothetical protein F4827_005996 [Paraburkholderia bannensis]|uniref:Uncharacterized protein n=1 Tax=Paraburkholderia bannensis TaxID=765414 RepID=A0A7W9WU86_9BURK|nr:hypothetical protein [Paraburkholderia sp. WP4_3_2]MBB6106125.1 hypothetical protein [Paraburkholderia bannensis]